MKHLSFIISLSIILILGAENSGFGQSVQSKTSNSIRIKLKEESKLVKIQKNLNTGIAKSGITEIDILNEKYKVKKMKRVFPYAGKFEQKHIVAGLHLWYELEIDSVKSKKDALKEYKEKGNVKHVEDVVPIILYGTHQSAGSSFPKELPNDPLYNKQWHYFNDGSTGTKGADIWLPNAWEIQTGDSDVIVAILDGGIDLTHPDLIPNLWINQDEIAGNNIDDDNNGIIDDIHGISLISNTGTILPDSDGHGTHVAGTVGGVTNNEIGVAGIAGGSGTGDGASIMSISLFEGYNVAKNFENGFVYAADNGAVIAQCSWGYGIPDYYSQSVLDAIDYFISNAGYDANNQPIGPMQGGVVFFASGNDGETGNYWPGCYEKVIAVGSTNRHDKRSNFSNFGSWVDISAPGELVFSTGLDNGYRSMTGTSMACPHVSGVAALIVSQYKNEITPQEVINRLLNSADKIDTLNPGFEGLIGAGRLNAYHALLPKTNSTGMPNPVTEISVDSVMTTSVEISWVTPGKDSNDTLSVSKYELFFNTTEINDTNYTLAESYSLPHPLPAGYTDKNILTGFKPATTYYLALRTVDYYGNKSVFTFFNFKTDFAPSISVEKEIYDTLRRDNAADTLYYTIRNEGKVELEYKINVSYPIGNFGAQNWVRILKNYWHVAPESSLDVPYIYITEQLPDGTYDAEISITTNDPENETLSIDLSLLLHGDIPGYNPGSDHINFGNTYLGGTNVHSYPIINNDAAHGMLLINEVNFDDEAFSCESDLPIYVEPGETKYVNIQFAPKILGSITGTATILSNDTTYNTFDFIVEGLSVEPPVLTHNFEALNVIVDKGKTEQLDFTISNSGTDSLRVNYLLESVSVRRYAESDYGTLHLCQIFSEDFEAGELPVGWESITNGFGWQFGKKLGSQNFIIPNHTSYASVNEDDKAEGNDGWADYLITPELNLKAVDTALLRFESFYTGVFNSDAHIEISNDNGATWIQYVKIEPFAGGWKLVDIDLTPFVGEKIKIAFRTCDNGVHATGWAIDNVSIYANFNWLEVTSSDNSELLEGESATVSLLFDATTLDPGIYEGNFVVLSNAPDAERLSFPLSFAVYNPEDAWLKTIEIDGSEKSGFRPDQYIYDHIVETNKIPVVTASPINPSSSIDILQATSIHGSNTERTAVITVTSESGATSKEYWIIFGGTSSIINLNEVSINVYPTTASDMIHLNGINVNNKNLSVSLVDLNGRIIVIEQLTNPEHTLYVSNVPSGFYILQVKAGNNIQLIKQIIINSN